MIKIVGRQLGTGLVDPNGGFFPKTMPGANAGEKLDAAKVETNLGGLNLFSELHPQKPKSTPAKPPGQFVY